MTIMDETKDLGQSLDGLREKMSLLDDCVQKTTKGGAFGDLESILRGGAAAGQAKRKEPEDIVKTELSKMLREGLQFPGAGPGRKEGGGSPMVVINNNTGAMVSARESEGPFNQKYLEITIDQMVAGALLRGRQTSGVLGSLFNLAPGLIGR